MSWVKTMYRNYIKRLLSIICCVIGLVLFWWVYVILAAAVYIDDPGPVFFRQKRVTKSENGEIRYFNILKFRSMKMSTPHDMPTHLLKNPEQYITRVGAVLRRFSLDELPQIFNVLKGDMAFVGPRPALWNQEDIIDMRCKNGSDKVRPGITGWAQINGRDEISNEKKADLDGYYASHLSFGMDLRCLFGTVLPALRGDGFSEGGKAEKSIAVISAHTPSIFWFRMDMMKAFANYGYKVYALGNEPEEKWADKFSAEGIVYRNIAVERNSLNPLGDLKTIISIKKQLKLIRPEKIFTYQAKTVIYGGIAARLSGIKEVYPLIAGVGSVFLKEDKKTKLVRKIMVAEYKLGMSKCPVVFFQNADDEQIFRSNHIIKKQRVAMIPGSGVNTEKFKTMPMPETFGFLCISRLIKDKGVIEYLDAARIVKKEYPSVRFMLVGPFDSNPSAVTKEELQKYIDDSTVEYFGEQEDVRPYIEQCNVFVLPSYREGTPKTNLEAMSCSRAVITTDAPGCRETVKNGENGFLVPVRDVEALCRKMKYFIENPAAASGMGQIGRKMAQEKFAIEIVNDIICRNMGISNQGE